MNCGDCKNKGKPICSVCCSYQGGVPDRWEPKPITNADRIRAMSDEELAAWLCDVAGWLPTFEGRVHPILEWLKQEAQP